MLGTLQPPTAFHMPAPSNAHDMPVTLPVFPLQGALLLPGARLPLNIFEPRYLAMIDDALASHRTIGMIQPRTPEQIEASDHPDIYPLGCAGRVTSFEETGDGRYLISLTGICRFSVTEELPLKNGYRMVRADYTQWASDFDHSSADSIDRDQLTKALKDYLTARQLDADWEALEKTPTDDLVAIVAMVCPFSAPEKQALLESPTLTERASLIISMLEMDSVSGMKSGSVN